MIRHSVLEGRSALRGSLLVAGTAAFATGLYGRFKGIGTWPFGVDEFYISRSIDNILRTGVPRFSCGGYYTRGLLYQYLVAAMRTAGTTPELAGRLLAACSSLLVLPAAHALGSRIGGRLCGWLTVFLLCISVWEIEMARFARMYAPFQAVFTWYLVFYLRYVVDRDEAALRVMVALSVAGVLVWEGGVFLGVANVVALILAGLADNERRARTWPRLLGLLMLLGALFLATRDLRGFGGAAPGEVDATSLPDQAQLTVQWLEATPLRSLFWAAGFLVPLALALAALPWLWSLRHRGLAAAGLSVALLCAAAHLFTAALASVVILLLAAQIERRDLTTRGARVWAAAGAAFLLYWAAFYRWSAYPAGMEAGVPPTPLARLFGFPDVYDGIVRPWGRTVPALALGLGFGIAFWCGKALRRARSAPNTPAALLIVLIAVCMAVGAAGTERIETRYTFFLYPLLLALAVSALVELLRRIGLPMLLVAWTPLAAFATTEDFQPRHLARIDSAEVNFRNGMSPQRAAHYYPRDDVRGLGEWLAAHRQPDALVVSDIPSLAQYYPGFDYFYLSDHDPRYEAYACSDGLTERWTEHRILYGIGALEPLVASGRPVYASLYPEDQARIRSAAAARGWSVASVWKSPHASTDLLLIAPHPSAQDRR